LRHKIAYGHEVSIDNIDAPNLHDSLIDVVNYLGYENANHYLNNLALLGQSIWTECPRAKRGQTV
jgi:hypothetical protein